MRIEVPGIRRTTEAFSFSFDGREVKAYPGESVAAALLAEGIYGFREMAGGQLRGVFCGMGVCGECQLLVDGESKRACMESARPGIEASRHPPRVEYRRQQSTTERGEWLEESPDVLVVGAGPAGLSAACTAAAAGLDVLVVDERRQAGGQYFKQPGVGFSVDPAAIDEQFSAGNRLIREAEAAGVRFSFSTIVWGVAGGARVAAAAEEKNLLIDARRLVLACGAFERAVPVPGWTLPGVMTTGAAQTLLRAYQTAPGSRVLVAGNGPLNLQVADELSRAGVRVVAVAELAGSPWRRSPAATLSMLVNSPPLAHAGLRHLFNLVRRSVPVYYNHALISVRGANRAESARIARLDGSGSPVAGSERQFKVDAVCLNYGFLPQSELAKALGCEFDYDHRTGRMIARRDDDGRSNIPQVFIIGDAGGLGGAKVAVEQGKLAGFAVARELAPEASSLKLSAARIRRRLNRHQRFQRALWRVFAAPFLTTELASDETLICRCESIERRHLDKLLAQNCPRLAAVKKATRAGMGRCQGRYCTTLIAALTEKHGGAPQPVDEFFASRPPVKPLPIARLSLPFGVPPEEIDVNLDKEEFSA